MASFIYVANWKMNVSLKQALHFHQEHWSELGALAKKTHSTLIICPSFISLGAYSTFAQSSTLFLGAQDCSAHTNGAYTGDSDALSLYQAGVTFCLVGHSERRHKYQETNELVAQKVAQLQLQHITPIVCIGESAEEQAQGKTVSVLQQQLKPVLTVTVATDGPLYIAYEPVWAIGSGKIPDRADLAAIFTSIQHYVQLFTNKKIFLLYGGSVTPSNKEIVKAIPNIDGVLIGAASRDFESLKNFLF
jgi:triosephosphate isomerase (TIM)